MNPVPRVPFLYAYSLDKNAPVTMEVDYLLRWDENELFAENPLFSTVLEHFTMCYEQPITSQKILLFKFQFVKRIDAILLVVLTSTYTPFGRSFAEQAIGFDGLFFLYFLLF